MFLARRRESGIDANRPPNHVRTYVWPAHKASAIELSVEHEHELNVLVRTHSTPQKLAEWFMIILLAASGLGVEADSGRTGDLAQDRQHVAAPLDGRGGNRRRGGAFERRAPRSGAPARFTPEVICKIVALSCEDPLEALDAPISHWSQSGTLARQAVQRGIVESISHGSVGRFLKKKRTLKPLSHPLLADTEARSLASTRNVLSIFCAVYPNGATPWPNRAVRPFRSTR